MENNEDTGARRTTLIALVVLLVGVFLVVGLFFINSDNKVTQTYLTLEDDTNIKSSIDSYMKGDNLIIEYTSNDDNVWIDGLPSDRYFIDDEKVTIYNYDQSENFNLHIGDESDIFVFGNNPIGSIISDNDYINDLRDVGSIEEKIIQDKNYSKEYIANEKRVKIKQDENVLLDIKLLTDYTNTGLLASDDTLVAEFFIGEHDTDIMFENIDLFDVNNNYNEETQREFRYKWGIEEEICRENRYGEIECINKTNWTSFTNLNEVSNNVKIGLFTETYANEHIEFIPTINEFAIFEWAAWTIGDATYNGANISLGTSASDIFWKSDGTKVYSADWSNGNAREYIVSDPWNLSSASYSTYKSLDGDVADLHPEGIFISPDGVYLYAIDYYYGAEIHMWKMSTPWLVSSASYKGESSNVPSQPVNLAFSADGTKYYVQSDDAVADRQYDMSMAWNISTSVDNSKFPGVSHCGDNDAGGIFWKTDGKVYYDACIGTQTIYENNVSTPWVWSTATHSGVTQSIDVAGQSQPDGIFIRPNGATLYMVDVGTDLGYQFDIGIDPPVVDIAWPVNGDTITTIVGHFNWTLTNQTYMDTCQYSLDGAANESLTCAPSGYEAIVTGEGAHDILISVEDEFGGLDYDQINFTQELPAPTVTINYPANGATYKTDVNHLNWSFTNATSLDDCEYSIDGATNVSVSCLDSYKVISLGDGAHTIIFSVQDDLNRNGSDTNTFNQDTTVPVINVTYPYETITNETVGHTLYFNWTATDATIGQSSCWYNYNNTNTTITCGDQNTTFVTSIEGQRNLTFYANDTLNNVANFTRYWDYKFLERSRTFNVTSYETTTDYYTLNMSSDGTQVVTAQLWYNNTNYTATKVGNNIEMTFTSEISHPWGEIGNQTFYWTVQHGSDLINTSADAQDVQGIHLGICNSTLVTPFINFTFKDEATDTFMNSTFEVYNWFYYVGDGSQNKTFDYVNSTEQESYAFCANVNLTFHNNASIKYKTDTYPERTYSQTTDLTNNTEYIVLYLLGSADGQYVTFQVQDQYGTTINGVTIQIEREFAGSWTFLGQDLTDSSGSATFFLNPDDNHRITATKDTYTTYVSTIRPTQSSYTIVMSSGATDTTDFLWEGIKYNTYPKTGTILAPNTSYDFGFNVTGIVGNITACKITITNSSFDEIGSATGCTAYGGNVTLNLGTGDNQKLFGNYYINFGSGYELLKSNDAWMVEMVNISSSGAYVWELMEKFVDYEEFGAGNKAEFNRITFFFILLVVGLGLFTKFTGVEITNPGTTLMVLWGIITMFSFVGLFAVEGIIRNGWLNKYAIWLMTSFLTWGFILNYWRRNAS